METCGQGYTPLVHQPLIISHCIRYQHVNCTEVGISINNNTSIALVLIHTITLARESVSKIMAD